MEVKYPSPQDSLSALIEQALAGEEVLIARAGKPLVRRVPLEPKSRYSRTPLTEQKLEKW